MNNYVCGCMHKDQCFKFVVLYMYNCVIVALLAGNLGNGMIIFGNELLVRLVDVGTNTCLRVNDISSTYTVVVCNLQQSYMLSIIYNTCSL